METAVSRGAVQMKQSLHSNQVSLFRHPILRYTDSNVNFLLSKIPELLYNQRYEYFSE